MGKIKCDRDCPDNLKGECSVGGCREMCGGGCVEPLPEWYYGDEGKDETK